MVTAIIPSLLFFVYKNSPRGGEALDHGQAQKYEQNFKKPEKRKCVFLKENQAFRFTFSRKILLSVEKIYFQCKASRTTRLCTYLEVAHVAAADGNLDRYFSGNEGLGKRLHV